jgi:hypothetical protein
VACGKLGEMDGGEGLMYVAARCYIWCALGQMVWCTVFCCVQRWWLGDARGVRYGLHAVSIPHSRSEKEMQVKTAGSKPGRVGMGPNFLMYYMLCSSIIHTWRWRAVASKWQCCYIVMY